MFRRLSDADRDRHRLAAHRAILPDLLVAGIQNRVWIRLFQTSACKPLRLFIQLPHDPADCGRAELVTAQLFGDGFHLARGHASYVHLQHRGYQSFFAPSISFEHFPAKPPLPVLRYSQFDVAYARR